MVRTLVVLALCAFATAHAQPPVIIASGSGAGGALLTGAVYYPAKPGKPAAPVARALVTIHKRGTSTQCETSAGVELKRGRTDAQGKFDFLFTTAESQHLPPKDELCIRARKDGPRKWKFVRKDAAAKPLNVGTIELAQSEPLLIVSSCDGCKSVSRRMRLDPAALRERLEYLEELRTLQSADADWAAERIALVNELKGNASATLPDDVTLLRSLSVLCTDEGCAAKHSGDWARLQQRIDTAIQSRERAAQQLGD